MSQLSVRTLCRSYADRTVLDGVDLDVGAGERLGLVGENGVGKSTLLRLVSGIEAPDSGSVHLVGSVGYLGQEPDLPVAGSVTDAVDAALADFRELEAGMRAAEKRLAEGDESVLEHYGELLAEYEARDGWSADARASRALAGLGLGDVDATRSVDTLSGGQRSRLALALALARAPDVLLLDEPTNHLDDDALAFLEEALRTHRGAVLTASHDRAFLDAVCTGILDLDPSLTIGGDGVPVIGPARYTGAYSDYLHGKAAARARWEQAHATWNDEGAEARAAIRQTARQVGHTNRARRDGDKFQPHFFGQKVDAAVSRRVRDAENRLEQLQRQRVPKPPRELRLDATLDAPVPPGVLVSAREARVPGRVRVPALDIAADTRLMVTGRNGSGKTSLLAVLAGALEPESGRVLRADRLRIGWLPQTGVFPDLEATALEVFAAGRPGPPSEHQAELARLGLVPGRDLRTPVGRLSVGQQRRLALARLIASRPQLLLLDEPTNHLSLDLVEELEEAVGVSGLPVVVVTHDRWARRRWQHATAAVVAGELVT
ncbi:macrolide transport system ATP-binding/permease protein [Haloactinopolyspora alba]|uniref:Macrolide transport system ATP-binding/permease protein n=1 Tax=Haloactinopolyspora alba TaxID=648780 RepID=A0A2P8DI66_9ACTN|nr:ABC-F family ATP-binding cassette domain-containing protein [Haloactinopolyspora alba]PSK96923.1 macrolide transport system ATP-binding/permease protein [Haloactinopolyspora alba]